MPVRRKVRPFASSVLRAAVRGSLRGSRWVAGRGRPAGRGPSGKVGMAEAQAEAQAEASLRKKVAAPSS